MEKKLEYRLPQGKGVIKKTKSFKKLSPLQQEIYRRVYDPVNGLLEFATHCVYVNRNGLQLYEPFDYQKEMLCDFLNYDKAVTLATRQGGKTVSSAVFLLWFATVFPFKQILITSQDMKSANEILTTIKLMYENCPDFLKRAVVKMNESELWFDNKSRIFSRASNNKAARGLSPAIIYCDEFALVGTQDSASKAREKQEEFFASITPALSSSHGKLLITSTPIAETDLYFSIWSGAIKKTDDNGIKISSDYILEIDGELYNDFHVFKTKEEGEEYLKSIGNPSNYRLVEKEPAGDNGFQSLFVTWERCPLKTKEWAEKEIKVIGEEKFMREYNCQFVGKSGTLVDSATMRNLMAKTKSMTYQYVVDENIRFYKQLDKSMKYLIAIDPSMGVYGDYAAIQVFEFPTFIQVAEWMDDKLNQNDQVEKLNNLVNWMYNDLKAKGCKSPEIYWSLENNSVGEGFICSLREKSFNKGWERPEDYIKRGIHISETDNKRLGFTTTKKSKTVLCAQLKNRLEKHQMTIMSSEYVKQLSNFTLKEVNYAATGKGEHDDLITSSLVILAMYLQARHTLDLDHIIQDWSYISNNNEDISLPFLFFSN